MRSGCRPTGSCRIGIFYLRSERRTTMAARAGPRNLITDVPGILVGQAEDQAGISGTTVVLAEAPAVASVDVRGGAPGGRETELLAPGTLVDRIDAVVLSGGSAFGLDAAAGVMDWLLEIGRGFTVGSVRVPIIPAAILFDLGFPGRQPWAGEPPYRALGRRAAATAGRDFALGHSGAGLGATAGRLKGAGKTTTMRSIMGLTPPGAGHVRWQGQEITGWSPHRVARAGIGYVPEDRRIFA